MSCIVAISNDRDTVWMGADSAILYNDRYERTVFPKVFKAGELIMGVVGPVIVCQTLKQYEFDQPGNMPTEKFLTDTFLVDLQEALAHNMFRALENDDFMEAEILVGVRGKIFIVDRTLGLFGGMSSFMAIGIGSEYATGALAFSHYDGITDHKKTCELALRVAQHYEGNIQSPFAVLEAVTAGPRNRSKGD